MGIVTICKNWEIFKSVLGLAIEEINVIKDTYGIEGDTIIDIINNIPD